ncbi:MAG: NAD-dependent dehydratase [Patescibacteria group bacterium]|nr:MAG: NAD-dependent dehydratase [Patescibacteria group bacterium]
MNVLITGGAGFIGSHLTKLHLKKGDYVIVIDNLSTGSKNNINELLNNKNFKFIHNDVLTFDFKLLNFNLNLIYHLASPASPNHHSLISYHHLAKETMLVNTLGTLKLLELTKKHQAKFLFASTSEIYGNPLIHPQKEPYFGNVNPIGPRAVYDEAKRFGETLTSYFWNKEKVDARIARIFNTYGPNMRIDDKRMIVNFICQALKDEPITIYGNGKQTRSLCFVDDLIDGLFKLMINKNTKSEVVNLGNPEEHTILEYAQIIKKLTNSKSEIIFKEPLPADDPEKRCPDISKAKKLLSWQPKVSLIEGLKKTINYFKNIL